MSEFFKLYQQMQNESLGSFFGGLFGGGKKPETPEEKMARLTSMGIPQWKAQWYVDNNQEPPEGGSGENPRLGGGGGGTPPPRGPYNRDNVPGVSDPRPDDRADSMAPNHNAGYKPINWKPPGS